MINEFRELVSAFIPLAPAIITILPIMWAFRSISKETADRYAEVTRECAAISKETADRYAAVTRETADRYVTVTKECKEDYKELNEKIYKLMLERGIK